jgi:hypothetical protein
MKHLGIRYVAMIFVAMTLGGCQLLGAGGSMLGSLLSLALYLAAIAAPILLSYYLYRRNIL